MKVLPHPGLPVLDVWLPGDLPAAVAGHTGDVLEHLPQHQLLQRRYGQRYGTRASSGRLRGGFEIPRVDLEISGQPTGFKIKEKFNVMVPKFTCNYPFRQLSILFCKQLCM